MNRYFLLELDFILEKDAVISVGILFSKFWRDSPRVCSLVMVMGPCLFSTFREFTDFATYYYFLCTKSQKKYVDDEEGYCIHYLVARIVRLEFLV